MTRSLQKPVAKFRLGLIVVALIIPIGIIWKIQLARTLRKVERAPNRTAISRTPSQLKRDLEVIRQQLADQIASLKNLIDTSQSSQQILNALARQIAGYATSTTTSTKETLPDSNTVK